MIEAIAGGIVALIVVALAAFGIGRSKGKAAGDRQATQAQREAAGERAKAEAAQDRRRIEDEVRELPARSDGDRLSAADRLRDKWSRDGG